MLQEGLVVYSEPAGLGSNLITLSIRFEQNCIVRI